MYSESFMCPNIATRYRPVNSIPRIGKNREPLSNGRMETIDEIRLRNLRELIAVDAGGNQRVFADMVEVQPAQVSQWISRAPDSKTGKPRVVSTATARHIEKKLGREQGWMDHDHAVNAANLTHEQRKVLEQWAKAPPSLRRAFQAGVSEDEQPARGKRSA